MRGYITDKYALWLQFRAINESTLHRTGRKIGSVGGGITLKMEKKAESTGVLNIYVNLIMDAQLNIKNGVFHFAMY